MLCVEFDCSDLKVYTIYSNNRILEVFVMFHIKDIGYIIWVALELVSVGEQLGDIWVGKIFLKSWNKWDICNKTYVAADDADCTVVHHQKGIELHPCIHRCTRCKTYDNSHSRPA